VITSVNDVGAKRVPRWFERMVGKRVALGAYSALLNAVRDGAAAPH
jgi:hypothetical protein